MTVEKDQVSLREPALVVPEEAPPRRLWSRRQGRPMPALPVVAAVAARPLWLVIGAAAGALLAAPFATVTGYTASASLQLTNVGPEDSRIRQVGETAQQLVSSRPVIQFAAAARNVPFRDLNGRVSARWLADTPLVTVSATASDAATAVADANAVAEAVVRVNARTGKDRLRQLRIQADEMLDGEALADKDADLARRSQLGSSVASRQDKIIADADGIAVLAPAVSATPSGLGWRTGGIAGMLGGFLLAALAAVLVGARGLRFRSEREIEALLPGAVVASSDQAAEVAGQLVESGQSCLAVVALPGAQAASGTFAAEVAEFVKGHGRSVTLIDTASLGSRGARRDLLRYDVRDDVPRTFGSDILLTVVSAEDDAFGMLVGQSNLRAVIVVRRRVTMVAALARALAALDRAKPVVILAP